MIFFFFFPPECNYFITTRAKVSYQLDFATVIRRTLIVYRFIGEIHLNFVKIDNTCYFLSSRKDTWILGIRLLPTMELSELNKPFKTEIIFKATMVENSIFLHKEHGLSL